MYTLYYAPGAASMAVHWLLIELDLPHTLELVDFSSKAQKSPAYLALNPSGVVPTLVMDGVPQHEVGALLMRLGELHPTADFAPLPTSPQRTDYLQWMFHLANAVQPLFRHWWYPHEPAGDAQVETVRAHVIPRIEAAWDRIDAHLAARGPYLLGGAVYGRLHADDADALVARNAAARQPVAAAGATGRPAQGAAVVSAAAGRGRTRRLAVTLPRSGRLPTPPIPRACR